MSAIVRRFARSLSASDTHYSFFHFYFAFRSTSKYYYCLIFLLDLKSAYSDANQLSAEDYVEHLQAFEKLGGSTAFKQLLEAPKQDVAAGIASLDNSPNRANALSNYNVRGHLGTLQIITAVAGHNGTGQFIDAGPDRTLNGIAGTLSYTSWQELTSAPNDAEFLDHNGYIVILFKIAGKLVAVFTATTGGIPVYSATGTFTWN